MMTLEKFEEASERLQKVTLETNLVYSDYFSAQTGNKVYFKPENMQFTGAYKLRGAYYKISTLSKEERATGLITASAGNHAQGVAYAARLMKAKAVIVMPTTTPLIKVNRTKGYGAEVILYGDVYDDACAYALKLAAERAIPLSILLMMRMWPQARGRLPWKLLKNCRQWTIFLCRSAAADWPRRVHPGKTAESENQSHRCRAGRGRTA